MPTATFDRTLALPDLAKAWGWPTGKLYRLVEAGAIPHLRIRGRIYFEESAVEAWKAAARRAVAHRPSVDPHQVSREEECRRLGIDPDHEFS